MLIGILQTGQAPRDLLADHGDYPAMFARLLATDDVEFKSWHVEGMEFPGSVHDADGWLITGARHGVYEDHPFIPPLEAFVRAAFDAEVPVVGICFGHQIMAQALGGRVARFSGGWAIGPQEYDFGGRALVMNAWHQDQVMEPPPGAEVIAQNDFCRYAGLSYGSRGLSVQAHPEFTDGFISGLIDTRGRGVVPDTQLERARAQLGEPLDSDLVAQWIIGFFRSATAAKGVRDVRVD